MRKLVLFALVAAALPLFALAAPDTPEAPSDPEVTFSEVVEVEVPVTVVETLIEGSVPSNCELGGPTFKFLGGQCIDSGIACPTRGCGSVCGSLTCDCVNGTCQYCP